MIHLGEMNQLQVHRTTENGFYLTDGEREILLPTGEAVGEVVEGDEVEVFVYFDKQGRPVATMTKPAITIDEYGWVDVVDVTTAGAFVNIGLKKDMLVSSDDLPFLHVVWPEVGDKLYCTLRIDKRGMLVAKPATEDIMLDEMKVVPVEMMNKDVWGHIYRATKVGSYIVTDEGYLGFIHESERREEPRLGQYVKGRVIDVKDDGRMNVSLVPRKEEALDGDAATVYAYMEARGGAMPFWDKSDADDIRERFKLSKAAFKRALGRLMKDGKVYQEEGWTYFKRD